MILTYKYRIKDSTSGKRLDAHARACNYVWNYLCETQRHAQNWRRRWPTAFDFINLTAGCSKELSLNADTINELCLFFVRARTAARGCPRFRSNRRSLGWIPLRSRTARVNGDQVSYLADRYRVWMSRELGGPVKTGAFVCDARGRWYLALQCEVAEAPKKTGPMVGVDLGLKTLATLSDGSVVPALQHYRQHEEALSKAKRAGSKHRARAIHAKIANVRKHYLHEESARIVRENAIIVVGSVAPSAFAQTNLAKSIYDASWSNFRSMLRYKCQKAGASYIEASERFTSQTCSECGSISGPKGREGLRVRQWDCPDCGASHDRDVNAARNILRAGLERQPRLGGVANEGEGTNISPSQAPPLPWV